MKRGLWRRKESCWLIGWLALHGIEIEKAGSLLEEEKDVNEEEQNDWGKSG